VFVVSILMVVVVHLCSWERYAQSSTSKRHSVPVLVVVKPSSLPAVQQVLVRVQCTWLAQRPPTPAAHQAPCRPRPDDAGLSCTTKLRCGTKQAKSTSLILVAVSRRNLPRTSRLSSVANRCVWLDNLALDYVSHTPFYRSGVASRLSGSAATGVAAYGFQLFIMFIIRLENIVSEWDFYEPAVIRKSQLTMAITGTSSASSLVLMPWLLLVRQSGNCYLSKQFSFWPDQSVYGI